MWWFHAPIFHELITTCLLTLYRSSCLLFRLGLNEGESLGPWGFQGAVGGIRGPGVSVVLRVRSDGAQDSVSTIRAPALIESGCCAPSPCHRQLMTQLRMEWGKRASFTLACTAGEDGPLSLSLMLSTFLPQRNPGMKRLLVLSWAALGEGRCQKVKQFLLPAPKVQIWIFFFFFGSSNVLELLWWTAGHVQNLCHLRVIVYQVSSEAPGPTKKLEPVHQPVRVRAETEVCTPITLHRPVWDASQDPSSMVWTPELTEACVSMVVTKLLLIT